uniref:Cytohesin 4b n=1 Tax=Seriola lalandi dorsalis TaxID=1841481 RepID=A0A3B4YGN4_SERLL
RFFSDEKMEIESIKTYKEDLMDDIQRILSVLPTIDEIIMKLDTFSRSTVGSVCLEHYIMNWKMLSNNLLCFACLRVQGINYLVENKLLDGGAHSIAEFLYKEEGLNKTAIGEFLGEREELHLQTLKAFVELHEFSDLNLVQALRQFLWSFRLPGEAQKIDRMMEAFATRYCDCNANVFQSTDTCYILSFAIIMLNTSLHNPNVKDKTTLERFISMNRGINNGEDLPDDLLSKLYESIRNEPFKIPEDDGNDLTHTFFNPDREGWLLKLGGRVKTWKRRWFILTDSCLYYFEFTTSLKPCPYFFFRGQKIKACKTETDGRVVEGKHQSYTICAASAEERDSWIEAISITKDPFYDLVSVRKKKVINQAPQD